MLMTSVLLLGQKSLHLIASSALITLPLGGAAGIMNMLMSVGALCAQKEAAFCAVILALLLFIVNA